MLSRRVTTTALIRSATSCRVIRPGLIPSGGGACMQPCASIPASNNKPDFGTSVIRAKLTTLRVPRHIRFADFSNNFVTTLRKGDGMGNGATACGATQASPGASANRPALAACTRKRTR